MEALAEQSIAENYNNFHPQ